MSCIITNKTQLNARQYHPEILFFVDLALKMWTYFERTVKIRWFGAEILSVIRAYFQKTLDLRLKYERNLRVF